MSSLADRPANPVVGDPAAHESARLHVTGAAMYTDDLAVHHPGTLTAWPVQSTNAHAKVRVDVSGAYEEPGVVYVLTAEDVPGVNDSGIKHDEPLFPDEARFYGQALVWVLGETQEAARRGAERVSVEYEPLPSLITVQEAIEAKSFQGIARTVQRGDAAKAMAESAHVFEGVSEFGGQEHFYLETHAAFAIRDSEGQYFIQSSTQHPSEAQEITAHVLGITSSEVTVQSLRMGGAFGGKEMQSHGFAAIAALGAKITGRPVRVRLNRTQDITMTGKRHPFHISWKMGVDEKGYFQALEATLTADGGWSLDLSEPVLGRALCHLDNSYWIPNVHAHGQIAKTNKTSNTAFRGFGGPQGIFLIEDIIGRIAPQIGIDAMTLRRQNFYQPGQTTPYGQLVKDAGRLEDIWGQLTDEADVEARQVEIAEFNKNSPHIKRGLALTPIKFGISFNFAAFNQAGALVHVYKDGSVLVNHGGTEMGQGLHTKMLQVAATALGLRLDQVRLAPTRTDKVPNTSATAASSGADLNGGAVKNACEQIRERMAKVGGRLLNADERDVRFEGGYVSALGNPKKLPFAEVAEAAYLQRVQLFAAGYYRTEGLHWNPEIMQGSPFKYFAYGAAATEVEVDEFTGGYRVRRVDIIHDVGDSLSPMLDIGQIEGAYVQGLGWLTLEELRWDESDGPHRGRLQTQSASTYKVPSFSEMPEVFNVRLFENAREDGAVYGSKAVGEPPFMLPFSAREAIRQAVGEFGPAGHEVVLGSPATPEAVFWSVQEAQKAAAGATDSDDEKRADRVLAGV